MSTGKGWGIPGRYNVNTENVDTIVCGVCTCRWRKDQCVGPKRCARLFGRGGMDDAIRTLRKLMGSNFPPEWDNLLKPVSAKVLKQRNDRMDYFEELEFKRCRPVKVTIDVRKGAK